MKFGRPSLTVQLGALFAVVAAIVFSAVATYLCHALAAQLQARDDADLVERALRIRHLLTETRDAAAVRADPHRILDAVDRARGVLMVIEAENGAALTQNTADRAFVGIARPVAAGREPSTADAVDATSGRGARMRALTAMGVVGDGGTQVRIALAHTADDRAAVMRGHRRTVLMAAFAGAVLTALLGFMLVRRGFDRVKSLARQAHEVSAHNLAKRLDAESAPEELRELARAFNAVLDRLQGSFVNLSQFADDLAHDLRTPLNNLMVQTEVVFSQPRSPEEYQDLLSSNYEEFGRLARMVESMLFLARADHDQIALATERLDVGAELGRIADYFEGPALDAGVSFAISAGGTVRADAHLFRRAVSNLVANAIRYTPRGGAVRLCAVAAPGGVAVSVSNPGAGIAPEHLSRLFDRFYRSDPSRSSASVSAGLGLAIVKSIMALHGGGATVTSDIGGPTCFSLFFPDAPLAAVI